MKSSLRILLPFLLWFGFCFSALAQTDPPINEPGFGCPIKKGAAMDGGISLVPPGLWSSHYCLGTDNRYHLRINAVQAQNGVSMGSDFMKLQNLEGKAYDDALVAFMTKYPSAAVKATDASVKDIWYPNRAAIYAAKPADVIVAPPVVLKTYIVAPNGTAKTRQWYAFDGSVRATAGGGSVTIAGTACKPSVAVVTEVGKVYAAFGPTFRADRLTLCQEQ